MRPWVVRRAIRSGRPWPVLVDMATEDLLDFAVDDMTSGRKSDLLWTVMTILSAGKL